MRAFASLQLLISEDPDQRQKYLNEIVAFDDTDPVVAATFQGGVITLNPSALDVPVAFGNISAASTVIIIAYSNIKVKLNGQSSPSIPCNITPADTAGTPISSLQKFDQPGIILWRGSIASIFLANPDPANPARVFVGLTGNATD